MKYSFILEIDEVSKDDINELISVLSDNKIKFHVLKSDKELKENQKYKEIINKAIELLGNYKHYSTPDEEQNSDNEDLVNKAFNILKEVEHEKSNN